MSYSFAYNVAEELTRARRKHPVNQTTRHGGYAVLLEEVDEVWDIVKQDGPDDELYKELVQVAAMAQRMAEDLRLNYEEA